MIDVAAATVGAVTWFVAVVVIHVDDVVGVGDINFAERPTDLVGDGISGVFLKVSNDNFRSLCGQLAGGGGSNS